MNKEEINKIKKEIKVIEEMRKRLDIIDCGSDEKVNELMVIIHHLHGIALDLRDFIN